jgi:hypothetical protein
MYTHRNIALGDDSFDICEEGNDTSESSKRDRPRPP